MNMYDYWLENIDEKDELMRLTDNERKEAFYKDLDFGTGGMRGIMGLGPNRINKYTIRHATQGLADEIKSHGQFYKDKGVVIAYDSRNHSYEFAQETAAVLCGNGIKTYLFESLRPTPELSFAVRHLGCARGVVITASHNPKEYNGYKIYGEDGGQLPPTDTDVISKYTSRTDIFKDIKTAESRAILIGKDVDASYLSAVYEQRLNINIPQDFKIIYTPLHGAGNIPVRSILDKIGIKNVLTVKEQENPDGNFSTVKVPNPEEMAVFDLAIKLAEKENADLILGTDPDSDRIGVVVRNNNGKYVVLNGNQTGVLLAEFILKNSNSIPPASYIVKTIVTTDMVDEIANDYNVKVDSVLTGFKYIGEKIKNYEKSGKNYVFGLEESYGYLKGTYARDKDAVVAAMLIAQMSAYYKSNGKTLYEALMTLYEQYGCYKQELISIKCDGIAGMDRIKTIMKELREDKPDEVTNVIDYLQGVNGLPCSNVIKFVLDNGWIVVRPSGTEPKIKIYIEIQGMDIEDTEKKLLRVKKAFLEKYIERK